jgi:glutathione S-transferase
MGQIKLWGVPKSINVQKALWALEELGLPFERIDAGGAFGKIKEADYLSLNPNGLIPTLQDDSAVVWESNAVVRYLFNRYGKAPLQPADPVARAHADQWTDWKSSTFWPPTRVLLVQLVRTSEDKRDQNAIKVAKDQTFAAAKILDAQLAKHPYVAGDHFTFGDIPVAAAAQRYLNLPIERPALKNLDAWYARIRERAGFKKWIDIPLA